MPCVNITKHSLTQKCFIHNLTSNLTCLEALCIACKFDTQIPSAIYDIWIEKYHNIHIVQINGRLFGNESTEISETEKKF